MKIALVCTGLGRVWRGYERYTFDLFHLVKNDLDITLFKGGGEANSREKTLPHLRHDGLLSTLTFLPREPLFYQMVSYAIFLIPRLAAGKFQIVHYSEPGLGNILYHAKRKLGLKVKLLLSNGVGLDPACLMYADHLHQLTDEYFADAKKKGFPDSRLTCLPYGVHGDRFLTEQNKASLREKYGIPKDKIVILAVSAINRGHKRIDYLVREIAQLDDRFFLLVSGNSEDPSVNRLASELLPGRHHFMSVPFDQVPEIYRLSDLFVQTSLMEGFCLSLVEAMCAGLPVLAHDNDHFRWLIGGSQGLSDLSVSGALSKKLAGVNFPLPAEDPVIEENRIRAMERFDWKNLKGRYLAMYERALA